MRAHTFVFSHIYIYIYMYIVFSSLIETPISEGFGMPPVWPLPSTTLASFVRMRGSRPEIPKCILGGPLYVKNVSIYIYLLFPCGF